MHAWVNAWKILAPWKFSSVLESPGLFNLSIRPLSGEKKKKREMSYSWTSSCHPRATWNDEESNGRKWVLGTGNRTDIFFFFFFFFHPPFITRSLYIVVLPSIYIIEITSKILYPISNERDIYIYIRNLTCLLRDLHHFNQSRSFYSFHFFKKNLKKILWAIHQSLLLHVLSVKWWKRIVFWKRNFGKKILGEKRGGGKNLSIRVFWHIVNHNVSTWPQQ